MTASKNSQRIVHQELALDTYLKTLLEELPDLEAAPEPELAPVQMLAPRLKSVTDVPAASSEKQQTIAKPQPALEQSAKPASPLAVMPEWSQHEFQAIFFKVGQLILASPLTELSRTIKFDRAVTKIPGQPSWFLGLFEDQSKKIGILDTGQLILGKAQGQKRDLIEQPFKSMLVTQDGNWALACDELLSIGKLMPEQVRWRTNRQNRPWLIGTVIEQLTAVIDVNQLTPRRKSG
ncbi:MAG: chemotaxis protein CheW [Gammaproteobacteria bacterium]